MPLIPIVTYLIPYTCYANIGYFLELYISTLIFLCCRKVKMYFYMPYIFIDKTVPTYIILHFYAGFHWNFLYLHNLSIYVSVFIFYNVNILKTNTLFYCDGGKIIAFFRQYNYNKVYQHCEHYINNGCKYK